MMPSQTLRNCKSYGCTYYEYSPGSEKCLSCLKGIKTGPFGSGGGAGAGAATPPPAQSSFKSMFSSAEDLSTKGLRPVVPMFLDLKIRFYVKKPPWSRTDMSGNLRDFTLRIIKFSCNFRGPKKSVFSSYSFEICSSDSRNSFSGSSSIGADPGIMEIQ